jgi:hypothetical protein
MTAAAAPAEAAAAAAANTHVQPTIDCDMHS